VVWNIKLAKTRKTVVSIILEYTNLDLGWVSGLKVGLAVEVLGMHQDVVKEDTGELPKNVLLNFV
jgi:hypothetical protein